MALLFLDCSVRVVSSDDERMLPSLPGIETTTAKCIEGSHTDTSSTSISIPMGSSRVERTARVWGCVFLSTNTESDFDLLTLWAIVTASATAVASSRSEPFASGSPVSSDTIV